ncbi:MAG: hypothetical protein PHQ98_01580 [Candidatus ainarchaeum sp.]|nr:hypothetical protein [Candidatus ainarchaeum sp.]
MSVTNISLNSSMGALAKTIARGKVAVLKTDKFFGTDELCVIGKLVEGAVSEEMFVCGDSSKKVVSVESKSGDRLCSKIGAQVVLMVAGVNKEEINVGEELHFEKTDVNKPKPMGRIIIA